MTCRAPLAHGALLLQDSVDVVHFAQPLEEGDEVQQLCVGHVIEPRGHGHLDDKPNIMSAAISMNCNSSVTVAFISYLHLQDKVGVCRSKFKVTGTHQHTLTALSG